MRWPWSPRRRAVKAREGQNRSTEVIKVSVVVATYNTGPLLDRVVASLDRQSLPVDEFEVVFIDDGSSDDTFPRLQEIAATRPNVVVDRIANSGWPGRPRNIGLGASSGEFVLFMDHDDELFPEALERAYGFGAKNASDVVIVKEVTTNAPTVGWTAFRRSIDATRTVNPAILALMTPHKLYRREFLVRHGVRFPEGRVRLEDYLFNILVYVQQPNVSVLSDYPCYRWNHHESQSTQTAFNQDTYWRIFGDCLDAIEGAPLPEEARRQLLVRLYRSRILQRVGIGLHERADGRRKRLVQRLAALTTARLPADLATLLSAVERPRDALLRAADVDSLVELSRVDTGVTVQVDLVSADWDDHTLIVRTRITLVDAEVRPIRLRRVGDRLMRVLPSGLSATISPALLDVTDDLNEAVVEMSVRGRNSGIEWIVPTEATVDLIGDGDYVLVRSDAEGRIDLKTAAFGQPLSKDVWGVLGRMSVLGYSSGRRVIAAELDSTSIEIDGSRVQAYRTLAGNLAIDLTRVPWPDAMAARVKPVDPAPLSAAISRQAQRIRPVALGSGLTRSPALMRALRGIARRWPWIRRAVRRLGLD